MVRNSNGEGLEDVKEEYLVNMSEDGYKNGNDKNTALENSTSRKALLDTEYPNLDKQDKLKLIPARLNILKFSSDVNIPSPSAKFRQIAEEKDEMSRSVPSSTSQGFRKRINVFVAKKIDWGSVWNVVRSWIKKPFNMALLLWITCVAVSGAILFLVMTGMLNGALPKKTQRDAWFEVNNQILNALFTLMCLYQHPKRFHHFVLLCRWRPKDVTVLRKIYCKNGTYKPNEWAHMMVVVVLLHINCFAQYALCSLNLGFKRSERPAIGVGVCLSVAIAAPAIAGVYSIVSPLGKDYVSELDEEAQNRTLTGNSTRRMSSERRFSFALRNDQRIVELAPVWGGGLFDIWDNIGIAYLSLFCGFCMFGWNMERLGFGNMYVHIATFVLLCIAPFWIFNLAAINIDNEVVRQALGLTGVVLCLFGLLYGGFWRIQIRKRFKLPENKTCCGKPDVADCVQWLCCCWCSLAQEIRTADMYDVVEDKFCKKEGDGKNDTSFSPSPLPYDGVVEYRYKATSPSPSRFGNIMKPPSLVSVQIEEFRTRNTGGEHLN
ncbi:PLAC8 family protein [Euphorbia peplus]|nr:PLAC8 family protein [Euphorbia peplus]